MARYACTDEGICALNMMADAITEKIEELIAGTENIQSVADEHTETLGPHADSLNDAIEAINSSIAQIKEPAQTISDQLKEVADCYREIFETDRFITMRGDAP